MVNLENMTPFTEIPQGELSGPFHRDPGGGLFLLIEIPPEGVRSLIDGLLSLGGTKSSPDTVRLIITVHQKETPLLLTEQFISLSRTKEEYAEFFSGERQSMAFFYSSEGKRFFILARQVRLDENLKEELFAMRDPSYPAVHRIPLSQADITPFLKPFYFFYRFEENALTDPSLLRRLDDGALLSGPFTLWTGRDHKGSFLLSDTPLRSLAPEKKNCHPLEEAALPYAFSTTAGIIFRIIIDKEGLEELKAKGDCKKYEERYPFWN
ncbi:MAG TPA: hypothetical protein PLF44_03325 [Candidatus Mcinerneyibacteriales bacterium]|nr:hypothetical protein [Candidatus Mcinerneyibacteriales bacterium]HPE19804.1 hypothetical protein [Candidatus Mcinerneyibacteriales bacterium]HPJ69890.1 hypothetical protein [Candidatus Mcinerneyibacteriales bacterium]HPQ89072.1 hypothetical protein [Candidatus Mcinerneyibacteriales bacterium]